MASPKTIELKRNNLLRRVLSFKVIENPVAGPSRAERRRQIQKWCRAFGIPYAEARAMIREEEWKMREKGIDPWTQKLEPEKTVEIRNVEDIL